VRKSIESRNESEELGRRREFVTSLNSSVLGCNSKRGKSQEEEEKEVGRLIKEREAMEIKRDWGGGHEGAILKGSYSFTTLWWRMEVAKEGGLWGGAFWGRETVGKRKGVVNH